MTMVRIVRNDGEPTAHVDPLSLADACLHAKTGAFGNDGFYRAEFVAPVPLYRVYTYDYTYDSIGGGHYIEPRSMPLAYALALAADTRERDRRCGIDNWRTVVRAAQ